MLKGRELTGGVEGLLKDQDTFRSDTLTKLEDKGVKWYVGEKPITSVDDMKKWAGGQPTGWPVGSIYEDVGGVYNKEAKSVCVSILGEFGSQSTIGHEAGHSIWHEILTSSQQQDFVRIQGDLYDDLGTYFQQSGRYSYTGANEMFAECVASMVRTQETKVASYTIHMGPSDQTNHEMTMAVGLSLEMKVKVKGKNLRLCIMGPLLIEHRR